MVSFESIDSYLFEKINVHTYITHMKLQIKNLIVKILYAIVTKLYSPPRIANS